MGGKLNRNVSDTQINLPCWQRVEEVLAADRTSSGLQWEETARSMSL